MKESSTSGASIARAVFGIIMIIIYVGMGVLLFINFFGWPVTWNWARYGAGVLFVAYGIWRAYRQFMGIDSRF